MTIFRTIWKKSGKRVRKTSSLPPGLTKWPTKCQNSSVRPSCYPENMMSSWPIPPIWEVAVWMLSCRSMSRIIIPTARATSLPFSLNNAEPWLSQTAIKPWLPSTPGCSFPAMKNCGKRYCKRWSLIWLILARVLLKKSAVKSYRLPALFYETNFQTDIKENIADLSSRRHKRAKRICFCPPKIGM